MRPIDTHSIQRDDRIAEKLDLLDAETIRDLLSEANQYLNAISATNDRIVGRSTTFLGWAIAALASLCAVLVSLLASGSAPWLSLVLIIYGIVAVSSVIAVLLRGALTRTSWFGPGGQPSIMIRDDVSDRVRDADDDVRARHILGWHLMEQQWKIDYDLAVNSRLLRVYRAAVTTFVGAMAVGAVLAVILSLLA